MSERKRGTVKFFNEQKGFGFIKPNDGSDDCFMHSSAIKGGGSTSLKEGDQVEYDAVKGQKGWQAENVETV